MTRNGIQQEGFFGKKFRLDVSGCGGIINTDVPQGFVFRFNIGCQIVGRGFEAGTFQVNIKTADLHRTPLRELPPAGNDQENVFQNLIQVGSVQSLINLVQTFQFFFSFTEVA